MVLANPIERELARRLARRFKGIKGLRRSEVREVFRPAAYLAPHMFRVTNYVRTTPLVAFNPGAALRGDDIYLFPRLIFDYYTYVSSIGVTRLRFNSLVGGSVEGPLETHIVLWPTEIWEFRGCEDARVHPLDGGYLVLYTGFGYAGGGRGRPVQAIAELDPDFRVVRKGYFTIKRGRRTFLPIGFKDSAILEVRGSTATMLTRPTIVRWGKLYDVCWRCVADLGDLAIDASSLEPVLGFEEWELKVGWSTNAVRLGSGEYLVGWHGVLRGDLSYRNGLALVDSEGNLLAVSDYLLAPRTLAEQYGDRPLVVFGDGLLLHRDLLVWVGGVADYAIGVYVAELDRVMEELKRVQ